MDGACSHFSFVATCSNSGEITPKTESASPISLRASSNPSATTTVISGTCSATAAAHAREKSRCGGKKTNFGIRLQGGRVKGGGGGDRKEQIEWPKGGAEEPFGT